MKKYYIGISSNYHDPAIALVDDYGKLIFAEATERFIQNKRALNTSPDSLFFLEKLLDYYPADDYEVAFNWTQFEQPFKYISIAAMVSFLRRNSGLARGMKKLLQMDDEELKGIIDFDFTSHFAARSQAGASLRYLLQTRYNKTPNTVTSFDHHLSHAYYSFMSSDFSNKKFNYGHQTQTPPCNYSGPERSFH